MATHQYTSPSGAVYQFEGPDELTPEFQQQVADYIASNEADTNQSPLATFGNATMQGMAQAATGVVGGAGAVINTVTGNTGADRSGLSTWADEMQKGAELNFPTNPANPIAAGLGQAVGQGIAMTGGGGLGLGFRSARAAANIGLGMAGLMGAQQGEKTADEFGITDPLKRAAMVGGFGAIEAGTEAIGGIGSTKFAKSLLKDVPSVLETGVESSAIKRGLKTASEEGGEEVLSGELQDITTKALAEEDPNNPGFALNGQPLPELASLSTLKNRGQEFLYGMAGGLVPGGVNAAFGTDAGNVMEYRQAVAEKRRDGKVLPEEDERVAQLDTKAQEYLRKAGISDEDQASAILAHLQRSDKTRNIVVEAADKAAVTAPSVSEALNEILEQTDRDAVLKDVGAAVQAIEPKPAVEEEKPKTQEPVVEDVSKNPLTPVQLDTSEEPQLSDQEALAQVIEDEKARADQRDNKRLLEEVIADERTKADQRDRAFQLEQLKRQEAQMRLQSILEEKRRQREADQRENKRLLEEVIADERDKANKREDQRLLEEVIADERTKAEQREAPPVEPVSTEETPEPVVEEPAATVAEPEPTTYEPEPLPPGAQVIQKQQGKSTVAKGRYPVVIYKDENGKMQQRAHFTNDPAQTFNQIAAGQEIRVPQGTKVHPDIKVSDGKVVGVNRSVNGSVRLIENQEQANAAARDDASAALRSEIQRDTPEVKAVKDAQRVAASGVLPEFPGESTFVDQPLLDRIKTIVAKVPRLDTVARENLESDILAKLVAVKRAGAFIGSQVGETLDEKKLSALAAPEVKGNRQLESLIRNYDATQEGNLSYIQNEVSKAKADTGRSVQTESLDATETGVTRDVSDSEENTNPARDGETAEDGIETLTKAGELIAKSRIKQLPAVLQDAILIDPSKMAMVADMSQELWEERLKSLSKVKAERIKAGYRSVRSIMEETDRLGLKDGQPKSILTALQRIADNKTGDNYHPHIVYVARALSKLTDSLSQIQDLRFSTANALHAASYRASDHSISLNLGTAWGEQQTVGEILVHEVGHALTSIKLNDPQTQYDKALAGEIEGMRSQISDYLSNVRPADAERFAYQLSNADEFVAGVFSNPPFVELLASLPERLVAGTPVSTKSNFFTSLLRKLWNLMLGKSVTPGSPLERAMDAVFSLAETPFTIPTAENVLNWTLGAKTEAAPSSKESLPGEHRELIVEAMRALPAGYTLNTDTSSDSPVWVRRSKPGVIFANPGILAAEVAGLSDVRRAEVLRALVSEEVAHTEDLKEMGDEEARRIARELAPETRAWINDMYGQDLNDIETVFEGFRMLRQRMRNGATTEEIRAFAASDPNFARRFLEYLRRMWKRLMANLDQDKTLANIKAVRSLVGGIDTLESLAVGEDDTKLGADQDSAYLSAVKSGNLEAAQRMVDAAAESSSIRSIILTPFFNHPNEEAVKAKVLRMASDYQSSGAEVYLSENGRGFSTDGGDEYRIDIEMLDEGAARAAEDPAYVTTEISNGTKTRLSSDLRPISEVVASDPVTYDVKGNVIPLSQRFNSGSDSILRASPWSWIRDQVKSTAGTVTSHRTKAPWFATQDENTPYKATGVAFGSGRKNVSIAEAERVKNAINTAEGRALTVLDRDIKAAAVKTMGSWDAAKALVGEAIGNNDNRMDYDQRKQYEKDHADAARAALSTYQSELGAARALENQGDYAGAATLKQAAQSKFKTDVSLAKDDFDHKVQQAEALARQQALAKQAAAMQALPQELRDAVQRARDRMDALTTEFINKGYGSDDLRATLSNNLGLYLHRSYSAFDSPHWAKWVMGKDPEAVRLRNKVETLIKTDLTAKKAAELIKANPALSQQAAITQAQGLLNDNEIEAKIQELLENSPDEFTSLVQGDGFKNGKPSSVIKRRGEIHPWIQEFWGKHDDPLLNISKSIGLTHAYLAQQSMLRKILNDGVENGYIFDDVGKAKGLVALKDKTEENMRLYPSLFRKDADGKIIGEWFVSPLVRDAIQDLEPASPGNDDAFTSKIWNVFRALTGYSMAAKTVYSPMALTRDFLSNITLLAIHGHMTPGFAAGTAAWSKSLAANAREVGLDRLLQGILSPVRGKAPVFSQAQMNQLDRLLTRSDELGITGNQMTTGVIKEMTKEYSKRFDLRGKDVNKLLKGLSSGLHNTAEFFAEWRALSDDIPKLVAWVNETLRTSQFHPNMTQAEAEEAAAKKVRMVMPTYSETSDFIKQWRKNPFFSPFLTFSGEIVRTMINTYKLGAQEMKSDSVGEKILGFHRMAMMTAMITVLPAVIQSAVSKFRPEDDPPVKTDELDTALPRFVSGWQKENMLLWLGKEGNKHTYLDLSYLAPYDVIHGILTGTARELFTNPDNVTIPGKVSAALQKAFDEATKPVAKEQLLTGAIIDTMRNQREPGDKFGLYNDKLATGWEKWTARLSNVWQQALEPGIVKSARGIIKGLNQEVDSSGRAYETGNEIRSLFGAKTMSQDIPTRLTRNGNGYARDLSDATMYASQPFSSAGTQDDETLIKAFARMNEAKLKVVGEIRKDWLAAQSLGMTAEEATKSLAISHLPKDMLSAAVSNEYVREPLSKQLLEKATANGQALGQDRMALYRRAVEAYPAKQKVLPY